MDRFGQTNNVISTYSKTVGGDYPVWIKRGDNLQGGGLIATADIPDDGIIPEGTMVIFNGIGKAVTIVKSTDTANLAKVNGLIAYNVVVPKDKTLVDATCAVTREGKIYADRAGIPASVEALLPNIEFVREA
jgi:hypothetical protein